MFRMVWEAILTLFVLTFFLVGCFYVYDVANAIYHYNDHTLSSKFIIPDKNGTVAILICPGPVQPLQIPLSSYEVNGNNIIATISESEQKLIVKSHCILGLALGN